MSLKKQLTEPETHPVYLTEDQIRVLLILVQDVDLEPLNLVEHEVAAWEALEAGLDEALYGIENPK